MSSAAVAQSQAAFPIAEMSRLFTAGHSLIPLGGGDDGKSPLVSFAGKKRLPLQVVLDRMKSARSTMYGIRLDGLTVADCDSDNDATRAFVSDRLNDTPFRVSTPRGFHLWYRSGSPPVPNRVRQGEVAIDFKMGPNAYVAGPGSVRPDGGTYALEGAPLTKLDSLPMLRVREIEQRTTEGKIAVGDRAFNLWAKAREFVECVNTLAELEAELRAYADYEFENAHTFTDADIAKSAKWTWEKRLSNDLYGGGKSAVKIYAHEFERLVGQPNGSDAIALLWTLRHNHEGYDRRGKPFTIAVRAMAQADTIEGWSSARYQRAKAALEGAGLIRPVFKGFAKRLPDGTVKGSKPSEYVFANPHQHKQGGGVSSYIHSICETSVDGGSANAA